MKPWDAEGRPRMWGPISSGSATTRSTASSRVSPGVLAEHDHPVGRRDLAAACGEQFDVVPVQEGSQLGARRDRRMPGGGRLRR